MANSPLILDKDLLWQDLGDEGVILCSVTSSYYRLNKSGLLSWQQLLKARDFNDWRNASVAALTEVFQIAQEQALQDFNAFAQSLAKARLIQAQPELS